MDNPSLIVVAIIALLTLAVLALRFGRIVLIGARAGRKGARIKVSELIGMELRKVDIRAVAESYAEARAAGLDVAVRDLETIELAGSSSGLVVSKMIEAKRSGQPLSFDDAAGEALQQCNPAFTAAIPGEVPEESGRVGLGHMLNLWIQAYLSGVRFSPTAFVRMRRRRVNIRTVVLSAIRAKKAGLDLSIETMEDHDRAGGRVATVVSALIAAKRAEIDLDWRRAAAYDLSGGDILEAVVQRVNQHTDAGRDFRPAGEVTA